jgi:hypothetical protein
MAPLPTTACRPAVQAVRRAPAAPAAPPAPTSPTAPPPIPSTPTRRKPPAIRAPPPWLYWDNGNALVLPRPRGVHGETATAERESVRLPEPGGRPCRTERASRLTRVGSASRAWRTSSLNRPVTPARRSLNPGGATASGAARRSVPPSSQTPSRRSRQNGSWGLPEPWGP